MKHKNIRTWKADAKRNMEPQFLQRCLLEHFAQVFEEDASDAALAASMFHYKEVTIPEVKAYVKEKGIAVRL